MFPVEQCLLRFCAQPLLTVRTKRIIRLVAGTTIVRSGHAK
jgi:hypothetical protein